LSDLTPMFRQYYQVKNEYADCIVMFRLGDFYEMFDEDAKIAARELELTLTARDSGKGKLPMAGVPHHAAASYIGTLIKKGYKVAICEQVEDPKEAKGLVRREVTRVITPGTVIDESVLSAKMNNYLCTIATNGRDYGLCHIDVSTGEFSVTEMTGRTASDRLIEEISRLRPSECIIDDAFSSQEVVTVLNEQYGIAVTPFDSDAFMFKRASERLCEHFKTKSLDGFDLSRKTLAVSAAGATLAYLQKIQKSALDHINAVYTYQMDESMVIDSTARRNLELFQTIRDGGDRGSLLWVLDMTVTSMGGRKLRRWLERPLVNIQDINDRLDAVEDLVSDIMILEQLQTRLSEVYDLERLITKAVYGSATARDLISMKLSIQRLPEIKQSLAGVSSALLGRLRDSVDELQDIEELIDISIEDEPPISVREGGIIKKGYSTDVDHLHDLMKSGKSWIAELENSEKERTGIKSLKVGFNKVFGYYIEVTKANLGLVPSDYTRKQTLANAERYITGELKERETEILTAEERVIELEYELFTSIREQVCAEAERIQRTADSIASLDVLASLAKVAIANNYTKPCISSTNELVIKDGRHPTVELMLRGAFVPNDLNMGDGENQMVLLTGPNMSGKSTYGKSVLLIQVMAQLGSFVPAKEAVIGVVDRIFVRAGSAEDLYAGHSTFMLELLETATILNSASKRSLIFIDELGRGTGTYDGMAISKAVIEYIHDKIGAKTIVSTHYHELTELEEYLENIKNYHVSARTKYQY
jgi:DNA mismatch repair protein MutS